MAALFTIYKHLVGMIRIFTGMALDKGFTFEPCALIVMSIGHIL